MGAEFCLVWAVGSSEVRNLALPTRPPLLTRRGDREEQKGYGALAGVVSHSQDLAHRIRAGSRQIGEHWSGSARSGKPGAEEKTGSSRECNCDCYRTATGGGELGPCGLGGVGWGPR